MLGTRAMGAEVTRLYFGTVINSMSIH